MRAVAIRVPSLILAMELGTHTVHTDRFHFMFKHWLVGRVTTMLQLGGVGPRRMLASVGCVSPSNYTQVHSAMARAGTHSIQGRVEVLDLQTKYIVASGFNASPIPWTPDLSPPHPHTHTLMKLPFTSTISCSWAPPWLCYQV